MNLYTDVTKAATLTDEHRAELRSRRGFSDECIDKARLFSGGPGLVAVIDEIAKANNVETMVRSGLYTASTTPPQTALQWREGIIIPYFEGEEVVYLRRHKFGPAGVPVQIYLPQCRRPSGSQVVLCESEFKALAATQLGFQAIGVPGIWSFSKARWPDLAKCIEDVEEILICFDSEDKANPAYKNFKADPTKRYDAEFCAYLLASLFVSKARKKARIATLPESWRIDGKADIDGALAVGKTRVDFEAVFGTAISHDLYLETLGEECKRIVQNRAAAFDNKTRLGIGHNCYWWTTTGDDGVERHRKVSNFMLELLATFDDPEGCLRMIVFIDEFGRRSRSFNIKPSEIASVAQFKEFVTGRGNYIWSGSEAALQAVFDHLYHRWGEKLIHRPRCTGWVNDRLWLFGNAGIMPDGKLILPDDDGIVYVGAGEGYRALDLGGADSRTSAGSRKPGLWLRESKYKLPYLTEALIDNFGSMAPAVGIGWMIGTLFSADLFPIWNCWPFLFLFGKRQGGKSTLARYLVNMAGIETEGLALPNTTPVAIGRYCAYYSSLPVWLDEYRNEKGQAPKDSFLRDVYNRQFSGKGIKAEFGVTAVPIRAGVIISGEDTPIDNGMFSRCLIVPVDEKDRRGHRYRELQEHCCEFSHVIPGLLAAKQGKIEAITREITEIQEGLMAKGINTRTAINWALAAGCYLQMVGLHSDGFLEYTIAEAQRTHAASEEESATCFFPADLLVMLRNGKLNAESHNHADLRVVDHFLYIRMRDAYSKWTQDMRARGHEPMKLATIAHALKDSPGYLGIRKQRVPVDKDSARCFCWDLDHADMDVRGLAGISDQTEDEE